MSERRSIPSVVCDLKFLPVEPVGFDPNDEEGFKHTRADVCLKASDWRTPSMCGMAEPPRVRTLTEFLIEVDRDGLPYDLYYDFLLPNREAERTVLFS